MRELAWDPPGIWVMIRVIKFQEQRCVRGRFSSCPRAAGEWLVHIAPQAQPPPAPAGLTVTLPGRSQVRGLDAAAAKMHEMGEKGRKGVHPGPLRCEDSWVRSCKNLVSTGSTTLPASWGVVRAATKD